MEELLLQLLIRLEAIGDRDESLFDTVVRDRMDESIFYGFLKPQPGYVLAEDYEMPASENRLIRDALETYIREAGMLAKTLGIDSFRGRLAAFQNLDVRTMQQNDYNDFFGWANPDQFDEAGEIQPRH